MEWEYSEFNLDELGFLGRGKSKHRPRNDSSLYGGEYPFIQTGDVRAANLYLNSFEQTYNDKGLAQSKLWDKETLIITIAANIAETAVLKIDACFPDSIVGFIPNEDMVDAYFVKYYIDYIKLEMQSISQGTTQDNLSLDKLRTFKFKVPKDRAIVSKISSTLLNYDNLIENNNRRIAILEEMAQSLYREWFVNFRYPGHAGDTKSADETCDAATDKNSNKPTLIDSPLGPIPAGWEVKKFSEVVNYKTGRLNSNAAVVGGDYPFFTCSRETFRTNTWSFDCECVLLAGNNANAIYPIKYFNGKFDAYQRTYVITEKNRREVTPSFLFYCLEIKLNQLKNISTGTSTRFLTKGILDNLDLLIPTPELMSEFNSTVLTLLHSQSNLRKRNENLKQQRDMLLPKLISGDIEL